MSFVAAAATATALGRTRIIVVFSTRPFLLSRFSSCVARPPLFPRKRIATIRIAATTMSSSPPPPDAADGGKATAAPYGSWRSPITADAVSGADKRFGGFHVGGDGRLVWIETRPEERGRAVLVKEPVEPGQKPLDIIPEEFAARTLAQEYGGGAFSLSGDTVIFSNYKDQRLYKQVIGGGPTAETRGILDINVQYWTSRGWAFVDVNYGGSTGYGRDYRERLLGKWGIVDVNDCCSCAKFLAESGKVDGERLCITGRSAGGYTTLACLAFRDTFKAGASLYGVADLSLLKAETHKFESCYMDNLVGDEKAFYERAPINFVDKFTCPVILFQGLDDKVVPPEQARKIYAALKEKGLPVALVEYEGEQHGFRKAENIKFTLEQQMVFFARLVGHFQVADEIVPIKIDNLD